MKVVVITGAGISAEAGIPTFESLYDPVVNDPSLTYDEQLVELNRRVAGVMELIGSSKFEPTDMHIACSELQQFHAVTIYTQNIDRLHEQAGSKDVLHIHGTPEDPVLWGGEARYLGSLYVDIDTADYVVVVGTRLLYEYLRQPLQDRAFFRPRTVIVYDPAEKHVLDGFITRVKTGNFAEHLRAMFVTQES